VNINGNAHAPDLDYNWIGEKPEMFLGTDYLLMREEFRELADKTPPWHDPAERALITFGGSDVNNATPDAVRAFNGFDLYVDVIIGPGFKNENNIRDRVNETNANFNLLRDPDDLPQRMFETDLAVSATGSTIYELLATGTPVIGIPQAENQRLIAEGLGNAILRNNTTKVTNEIANLIEDTDMRRRLYKEGQHLVDGLGARRVYKKLNKIVLDTP
jgi:spore coat polysaccharide biosynthesis predicted glycosyltransferase SpsG